MILVSAILLPVLAMSFWLYVRARPQGQPPEAVRRFDAATLGLVVATSVGMALYLWLTIGQGVDRAWWPVLAVFVGIVATIVILVVAGLIRARRFRGDAGQ